MSGVVITGPFEILEAQNNFYENLFKSRHKRCEQQHGSSFSYNNLQMSTLSNASSNLVKVQLAWKNAPGC